MSVPPQIRYIFFVFLIALGVAAIIRWGVPFVMALLRKEKKEYTNLNNVLKKKVK